MIYGIEQSIDPLDRRTKIEKFTCKSAAIKWVMQGRLTVKYVNPPYNYHRLIRSAYELEGRINKRDALFDCDVATANSRNENDNKAAYIFKYGKAICLAK